jgi:hypothetical protein
MKKIVSLIVLSSFLAQLFSCSGSRTLSLEDPPIGESVKINLITGEKLTGVLLKKEGNLITYIDSASNKPETIEVKKIRTIEHSDTVYDLEGKIITESDISKEKGVTKTLGYGLGGFVLGAAVGFGVGVIISSAEEIPLIYPMGILGLTGGIYFGLKGNKSDSEDAVDSIRRTRYLKTQAELKRQLEEEQKKLEEQEAERNKIKI